jgi:DNA primase
MSGKADLQAVKERLDIVTIISRYLSLSKSGSNYKGNCPFHKDDTPSLMVSPEKGLWHCFGCGEGGDVFSFLMKIERISFSEALSRLAAEAGVSIDRKETDELAGLREIHAQVAGYFAENLRKGPGKRARTYLIDRGFDKASWERFGLGYALSSWDHLKKRFTPRYTDKALVTLGLLVSGKEHPYDRFRDRVIFPIHDLSGRPIAFGGRALSGEPKYLNSPKTPLFDKSRQLYGLHWARDALRERRSALLVEGYTDVLSLLQAGIENVVGSMGTSLTQGQADLLGRFVQEVVIAYDPDAAGSAASLRGMQILRNSGLSVRVAQLPEGEDPDSLVRAGGAGPMLAATEAALPFHLFYLDALGRRHDLETIGGKEDALDEARSFYQGIASLPLRQEIVQRLAEALDLPVEDVRAEMAAKGRRQRPKEDDKTQERFGPNEVILSLLLRGAVGWSQIRSVAAIDAFTPGDRPIVEAISEAKEPIELSAVVADLDESLKARVSALGLSPLPFTDVDKALQDALLKLVRLPAIEKRLAVLREEIEQAEQDGDHERLNALQQTYSGLIAERLARRFDGPSKKES